jgi:miniconductance mechanosensitive channel
MIDLQLWIEQNPLLAAAALILLSAATFLIARGILARGLLYIARRTKTKVDDIIVRNLHPFRVAWLAPLVIIYSFAYLLPDYQVIIEKTALFLILWVCVVTLNALLSALNEIYESSRSFKGASIQGYLDISKILVILVGIILSISLFTGQSPLVLLTGLGAITAVLLLVFQSTILSLVASVQIGVQDLIKEGDWIEVPSYDADGEVLNISLHTIKIQNWDKTISVIPTSKVMDVAFRNWRGMEESGGRRIKRALSIDMASIKFCTDEMIERYRSIDILRPHLDRKLAEIAAHNEKHGAGGDSIIDAHRLTNVGVFRTYIEAYLRNLDALHKKGMTLLVRQLEPGPTGLPLEIYAFTKTTEWEKYEAIQAEIFDHLLASASQFDLRIFQEPSTTDFSAFARALKN